MTVATFDKDLVVMVMAEKERRAVQRNEDNISDGLVGGPEQAALRTGERREHVLCPKVAKRTKMIVFSTVTIVKYIQFNTTRFVRSNLTRNVFFTSESSHTSHSTAIHCFTQKSDHLVSAK